MAVGLARFVFDYAVPMLLVRVFTNAHLPDVVPVKMWLSFYGPLFAIYGFAMLVARVRFQRDLMGQTIVGFGCAFGNTILLGLPLVLLTFGDEGAVPFFILLSIHGLLTFTVTTILLELGKNRHGSLSRMPSRILIGLARNPLIIAIVIGLALNFAGLTLPGPVDQIAEYLQQAVTPCALFSLGATLTRYRIAGRLEQSLFVVAMKIVAFPLLVWVLAVPVFELPAVVAMVLVLIAAQPCGVNLYLFAQRYEVGVALATTSVFISSVLSMFSLSLLLYLFAQVMT